MNLQSKLEALGLVGFEFKNFPEASCTTPNVREPDVRDSTELYFCVVVDKQFPNRLEVYQLRPYTAPELDSPYALLFGWVDAAGQNYYDHFERNVHDDDQIVVAWRRVPGDKAVSFT